MNIERPRLIQKGKNAHIKDVIDGIMNDSVHGIITFGVDPGYTLPNGNEFVKSLKKLDLSVVFSLKENETSIGAEYVAAIPHYLESWGDYEFKLGHYSLAQPTIRPLFDTRQFQDVLLKWTGKESNYYKEINHFIVKNKEINYWN